MFHDLPPAVAARMRALEAADAADRLDGTAHLERLRQIPPDTGRLLALLAASAPEGALIEIGTSAGYSTLWLALAARQRGCRVTTYEVLEAKAARARETFALAGVADVVDLVVGDAREFLSTGPAIGFCFLDAEKDVYLDVWHLIADALVPGGLLVADNVLSHADQLAPFRDAVLADERVDAVVVPIGKGELVARRRV
ncbi:MAG: O-methyltransferase [Acidimicrobiales bacterium]